jgi:hypothetical protein
MKVVCYTAMMLVMGAGIAGAAIIVWDGGGGADMSWGNAANWSPDTTDISNQSLVFSNSAASPVSGTFGIIPRASKVYYDANYDTDSTSGGNDVLFCFVPEGTVISAR